MSAPIFLAVIMAALLHAVWNSIVKGGYDKSLSMTAVVLGQALAALLVLPFVAAPDAASLFFIAGSIALHLGYQVFLMMSYRIGDLTQVYPIARGTAPLLVAGVSVGFLGVHLGRMELLAVAIIGAGIMSMSLVRQQDGLRNGRAAVLALVTGCFIAAYSLVDGIGAREAGTALGFYCWVAIGNGLAFAGMIAVWRPKLLLGLPRAMPVVTIGGGASFVAYALVVYAFTQAPIALVTALRETSIIFALLIGVFFLRERLDLAKVVSTMITLCGAALLRLSKS